MTGAGQWASALHARGEQGRGPLGVSRRRPAHGLGAAVGGVGQLGPLPRLGCLAATHVRLGGVALGVGERGRQGEPAGHLVGEEVGHPLGMGSNGPSPRRHHGRQLMGERGHDPHRPVRPLGEVPL